MRKFKKFRSHTLAAPVESRQRWMRSRTFHSLLIAVAGALMLLAAFASSAKADVIAYFNFEDSTVGGPPDFTSEFDQGLGVNTTIVTNYDPASMNSVTPGLAENRLVADTDPNNLSVHLFRSGLNDPADFDIPLFSPGFFQDMTVSFGINVQGNGFELVTLWYSIDGGANFINSGNSAPLTTGGPQVISLAVPVAANNAPNLVLRLEFTGGNSNGVNDQDIIDNILVGGTIVPEPATVAGGLLGVLGLCWFQRRRLIRSVRLRRT